MFSQIVMETCFNQIHDDASFVPMKQAKEATWNRHVSPLKQGVKKANGSFVSVKQYLVTEHSIELGHWTKFQLHVET
jgi:hypothetical protein